jgi:hypothetical protein
MLDLTASASEAGIVRCAIPRPMHDFSFGGWLELERIDDKEDLIPLLRSWLGDSLLVKQCPGFNDSILDTMCTQAGGDYICAINMDCLEIIDCPNVSVKGLERLVNTLCRPSAEPRLAAVRVYGLEPQFSEEDLSWFDTNVDEFDNWSCRRFVE